MPAQSRNASAIFAFAGLSLLALVYFVDLQTLGDLTREDGVVENLTALFFAGGVLASLYAVFKRRMIFLAVIWALLSAFFLGEEVSWFQRVFDYSVPFVEQNSTQSEFNLHNLNFLNTNRVLLSDGSVELSPISLLMSSQNLFRIGFGTYFLLMPLASLLPFATRLLDRVGYVRPTVFFLAAIWGVILVSFVLTITTQPPLKDYVTEMREVFYGAVIFIYTLSLSARPADKATQNKGRLSI